MLKEHAYCGKENFILAYKFAASKKAVPYHEGLEFAMHKLVDQLLNFFQFVPHADLFDII